MTHLPLADRPLLPAEVERIRLLLSTFQDGTGMLAGGKRPGWRDFERAVALAVGGVPQEDKSVFDVVLHDTETQTQCGISCKMTKHRSRFERTQRAFMELTNAAAQF